MKLGFNSLAARELNDAVEYYRLRGTELASAFLNDLQRSLGEITKYPGLAPVVRGDVRRQMLRRFPYALLYRVKPNGIRILAVMNLKRRPDYWIGRS